ncbi:MAG: hypothetical protein HHJ09_05985 [Glaciimonas sp.]|nr:hypothetical protein [Glaciimonas sp.]
MNSPPDHGIPLPPLSDEAAVEILDFLGVMFQIFETRYANQIYRYYQTSNIVRPHPSTTTDDEPF